MRTRISPYTNWAVSALVFAPDILLGHTEIARSQDRLMLRNDDKFGQIEHAFKSCSEGRSRPGPDVLFMKE